MPLSSNVARKLQEARAAKESGNTAAHMAARQEIAALRIEEYIERVLSAAPPLTPEQSQRIAATIQTARPRVA